jgi:hypothetical protein
MHEFRYISHGAILVTPASSRHRRRMLAGDTLVLIPSSIIVKASDETQKQIDPERLKKAIQYLRNERQR